MLTETNSDTVFAIIYRFTDGPDEGKFSACVSRNRISAGVKIPA